jgi:predicted ATPase
VFVELFARTPGSWFAIQQPEVHLHPRAQAAIGDILYELATIESKGFLVETHSDYLIDRFRFNLKKGSRKPSAQILYFERCETGNRVYELEIGENGELPPDQPKGYRNFFVKEQLRVLGLDDVHRN